MANGSTDELCDYLNIKTARLQEKDESEQKPGTNGKVFRHWTNVWVVLHAELSPSFSYIGHCKKESDWLVNNKIEKFFLGEAFELEKQAVGYSKKFDHVIQVTFKTFRVDLAFDSETKMNIWFNKLQAISYCYHVDLVRCPEHPEMEAEYVIEVGQASFKAWALQPDTENKVKWEWQLKHIRRVHWHKNVHKLEVEPGRSSQTGEGRFYFTGQYAFRLFSIMRHQMTNRVATPPNPSSPITLPTQQHSRRSSEQSPLLQSMQINPLYNQVERRDPHSEDDWTGEDWTGGTGTSDSGFFVGSSVPRQTEMRDHFILPSGPAPPLPDRGPRQQTNHYMDINMRTLDPDAEYVRIQRREHVYDTPPYENGMATPTNSRPHYQVPRPHLAMSASQNGISRLSTTDDYCQMNSVVIARDIKRNGSLPMERPPPIPPHQKGVTGPPTAWVDPHSRTNRVQ